MTKYKKFAIQKGTTTGNIRISALTPAAWNALKGGYGLNTPREVTFKPEQVKSINAAKALIRELYNREDHFMNQQAELTRRAIRTSSFAN